MNTLECKPSNQAALISICIPTYNRPLLLREAINSCFAQTYSPFEILIGDDSKNDHTEIMVAELPLEYREKICYFRNKPSLGQNENVNFLFSRARGERLTLLHDDDLLLPNALSALSDCWVKCPALSAAFGRQFVISMSGQVLSAETERRNNVLCRNVDKAGLLNCPSEAGLMQMFPNNGFMVKTDVARRVGYRSFYEVGDACDYDFALRLCVSEENIWFLADYISCYRYTDIALSKSSISAHYVHKLLQSVNVPANASGVLARAKRHFAWTACSAYARLGDWRNAAKIICSNDYTFRRRLHPRFLFHIALIFGALVGGEAGAARVEECKVRISRVFLFACNRGRNESSKGIH